MFRPAWQAVVDAARIGEGTSLLDLGCGDGAFCAFAADRGATVHGLDAEPDSIAHAMEAVPDGDFRLGMMETLPWSDGSFDVVTTFNAMQYALDPELAMAEASRVVRIGGRIAVCKWGPPAENQFFAFLAAVGANGVRAQPDAGDDPVAGAIAAAHLELLVTGDVPAGIEMAGDAALEESLCRAGIVPELGLSTEAESVIAAAAPYRQSDGSYRFNNHLRFWVLRRSW
ncbi:MAG: class I SAM-dependent methyltransferase [Solirubrobacteraceae bacterium]